jgi:hypothetical protein
MRYPAHTTAESDFSGSCIGGYGSSPSRRGPSTQRGFRPTQRPPGSRARSVRACQVLRPRRVTQALAMTLLSMLPSATQTASAPGITFLSRLDGWPARPPADASPTSSRIPAHGSKRLELRSDSIGTEKALGRFVSLYCFPICSHSQRATASGDDEASLPLARRLASRIASMPMLPSKGCSAACSFSSPARFGASSTIAS